MHVCCVVGEGVEDVERVTYAELRRLVEEYAHALQRVGVKCGDRVVGKFTKFTNCTFTIELCLQGLFTSALIYCAQVGVALLAVRRR